MNKIENINLDQVFIMQYDYIGDIAVGRIEGYDEKIFLINKNERSAYIIPEKYQKTPIIIYHPAGGVDESGMIMVSEYGEMNLQYHHNFADVAGLWGWIDLEGNEIIKPQYIFAMSFFEGKAIVCKGNWIINDNNEYWFDEEKWGMIDTKGKEIVPCIFDELYDIENTNRYILCHEGGWENGYNCIYDIELKKIIVKLDFDFDNGYMFNECSFINNCICFDEHIPGEEKDFCYIYSIDEEKWIAYKEIYEKRQVNGETKIIVNKDGEEIVVF